MLAIFVLQCVAPLTSSDILEGRGARIPHMASMTAVGLSVYFVWFLHSVGLAHHGIVEDHAPITRIGFPSPLSIEDS